MNKLWVDDVRPAPEGWVWLKTSAEAIDWLEASRILVRTSSAIYGDEIMSLDHDLGGDDTTRPVVIWMCENGYWPQEVVVHSANPVGIEWLEGMIERYKPHGVE